MKKLREKMYWHVENAVDREDDKP